MGQENYNFTELKGIKKFYDGYVDYLYKLLKGLEGQPIIDFADELEKARQAGNTIFFVGNGGSAASASHLVNDFGTDIQKYTNTEKPFRVLSLTDNAAVMLAVANDTGYDNIFLNQLSIQYKAGDKLVAISVSGNSPNVVKAAQWVKEHGGTVISLVGFNGGKLKDISDVCIHVKSHKGEYGPVEDAHLIIGHLLSNWLQCRIKSQEEYYNDKKIKKC